MDISGMKILIAIDSFKGSLTSPEAGRAAAEGIRRVLPEADIAVKPVADGGEGTVEALVSGLGGHMTEAEVSDPLGRPITAVYGILPYNTAVMEMSATSGLPLLSDDELDPMSATTFGTGEMILDAVRRGCRNFIIGIGGSATNDGGAGCLQALGFGMLDKDGRQIARGARGLSQLARITADGVIPELKECRFNVACDVTNPLCGDNGCSAVFAPQKGADAEAVRLMDGYMRRYAELARDFCPAASPDTSGAGAAGGMGFALMYFLGAKLSPGADLIIRETGLEEAVKKADLVITGEGCIDGQTAMGKAPVRIAALARKHGRPVIALCGAVRSGAELCLGKGIGAYFPVIRDVCSPKQAMDSSIARKNLADTAEQVFRCISLFSE